MKTPTLPTSVRPLRRAEREHDVETYLKTLCKSLGWLCLKWVSPGHNGVPDRIVIGGGHVWFVELKRPGEEPTKLQASVHAELRACGVDVVVLDRREAVLTWLREVSNA